ncbi:MAG: hypothetical protein O2816_08520, partial [Planctomycetota bacterium]|nr:hypothetical protein [Planctomycetota bacterium]
MKISPQHMGPLQPARHTEQASRTQPQEVGSRQRSQQARPADRVELERQGRTDEGHSATERVEALADKVSERLANLAEATGADLSELEAKFSQNIDRLLEGIADGSLSERDVANGIAATLEDLSREVQTNVERPELRSTTGEEGRSESISARVEGLAADVESRIVNLAAELGLEDDQARELVSSFQGNLDRLLNGVANGTIDGDALQSGVQNILSQVTNDLQRSVSEPVRDGRSTGDVVPPTSQARFDDAVSSIEDRLANAGEGLTGAQARAFSELEKAFQSAMDRLGDATFEGSLSRAEFKDLFQSLVSDLGRDLQGILGSDVDQP